MTPALRAACAEAAHVILPSGRIYRGGRAAVYVLGRVGFRPLARVLRQVPLIWLVELGYAIVARNRPFFSRFFFTKE